MGNFNRVKESVSLLDFAEQYLKKSRGGLWCCPSCKSGDTGRANSDGALSITNDGMSWKCFSCHRGGDIFDLAAIVFDISESDRSEQLKAVADWAGIPLDDGEPKAGGFQAKGTDWANVKSAGETAKQSPTDYTEGRKREAEYIKRSQALIASPEARLYLEARGLSLDEARAAGLGYDGKRYNPVTRQTSPRIVIPWRGVDWYHIDRAALSDESPKYLKPSAEKVGKQPLYNPQAAREPAFFIVEGVLDAIAVKLCGYESIALASNSISDRNITELTEGVEAQGKRRGVAILMLDSDSEGVEGSNRVREAFTKRGILHIQKFIPQGANVKDPMEWYAKDKEALRSHLEAAYKEAVEYAGELEEEAYREALESFRVKDPSNVASDIYLLKDCEEPTATGIEGLDKVLDGGLRSGLYALGAVSSMGKTTLAVQIADYIAEHGRGVLFVTIEQSAREIVAKSLSRLTRTLNDDGYNIVSATEAVSPSWRAGWGEKKTAAFLKACDAYAARVAPNLRILEGTKQPKITDVEAVARMMAAHDGQAPVIFIDYLQLLAPEDDKDTDKRAVDKNVMALRQLARDMRAPIIAISSLNRSSYSEGVTMDAWKESGAVEYGCDVLLGLQPKGIRDKIDNAKETRVKRETDKAIRKHKAGDVRECELVVLKNRNGATPNDGIALIFKPLSALYTEGDLKQGEPRRKVI